GAVLANYISKTFDWQIAYFIGGGLGLMLLIARISVLESGMFLKTKESGITRGNMLQLFTRGSRLKRFLGCILIGLPIWYSIGILITFSPEFSRALGIKGEILSGDAVMYSYFGLAAGDLSSGFFSQWFRSRKKVVAAFILLTLAFILLFLFTPSDSASLFYVNCFAIGFGVGYWAVFVTIAAEQFGTNLRSTVATTVPYCLRGTSIPIVIAFQFVRDQVAAHYTPSAGQELATNYGIIYGALVVGVVTVVIALIALRSIDETYGRDLNFQETD